MKPNRSPLPVGLEPNRLPLPVGLEPNRSPLPVRVDYWTPVTRRARKRAIVQLRVMLRRLIY
jgi:hypothetical protein